MAAVAVFRAGFGGIAKKQCRKMPVLLHDAAITNAGGAHQEGFVGAVNESLYAAQVWLPSAWRDIVRVADSVSVNRPLSANLASASHRLKPF